MSAIERSSEKGGLTRHFDELNLARLSLISMQSRVGRDCIAWEDSYGSGEDAVTIKCIGTRDYLVPHGTDNDVIIGILCLFAADNFPEHNAIVTTANNLLRASGLDTSGRYHKGLHESLMRLSHSNFHIERGWHDGKRFRTVIFRHIHELMFDTAQSGGTLDQDSTITIVLPPAIAESLRRGYLKPLDSSLLTQLRQPTSRTLYRLLDGHRQNLDAPKQPLQALSVNIVEWGRKARIIDLRPDKIRRILDPAHTDLLQAGYLSSVNYTGRGQTQLIHYVFQDEVAMLDPGLLNRLTGYGIVPKVARSLMETFGIETVRERLDEIERMTAGKKTPGPGFFVNFIRRPEDYRTPEKVKAAPGPRKPSVQPRLLEMEMDPDEAFQQRLGTLSAPERAAEVVRSLKVLYGSRLKSEEYQKLKEILEVDGLDGAALKAAAAQAAASQTVDQQVEQLQRQIQSFGTESV